jgi:hypothetical protein
VDGVEHLAESGYVVLGNGDGDRAVFDAGPVAPAHLPGHAHADVLSFVLWAEGRPVVVDPGSFTYTGPMRDRFRSTAAHNTVEVDGHDQCEFWSDFRAAYLPEVMPAVVQRHGEVVVVTAGHNGYRRLTDPVTHHRSLVWWPGVGLVVVDLLRARQPHRVRSALHLTPGERLTFSLHAGPFRIEALGASPRPRGASGLYSPYLGASVEAPVVEDVRTIEPEAPFGWSLLREGAAVTELSRERIVLVRDGHEPAVIPLRWS